MKGLKPLFVLLAVSLWLVEVTAANSVTYFAAASSLVDLQGLIETASLSPPHPRMPHPRNILVQRLLEPPFECLDMSMHVVNMLLTPYSAQCATPTVDSLCTLLLLLPLLYTIT
jgi:hypothetical protein